MKRALKFLAVFLAAAAFIFALVIGLNYSAFKTLFENAEGMAEGSEFVENTYSLKDLTRFIGDKPEFVSIVSYNVNDPDSGIFYQADTPRTLGFMGSIFLVAEYERQVAEGLINPDELIVLKEVETYLLPQVSQNAHEGAAEVLTTEDDSFTLDEAVSTMLEYNDLAIHDYLWFRLGEQNLRSMVDRFDLEITEMPLPFSGIYTVISPVLGTDAEASVRAEEYFFDLRNTMSRSEMFETMIASAGFNANPEQIRARKKKMESERLGLTFIEERDALALFPQTTARELTRVMETIYTDSLISPGISQAVKEKLRWSMDSTPIQRSFSDYGAIYDNRMGVLSGVDFGTSIYDGHTSIQAVLFDKLPVGFWHHMSANHMQEDFQQRLIWDPALYETTIDQINRKSLRGVTE